MATYLLDFDGVFFRYGTMEPVEGAIEYVADLKSNGHRVIFLTARRRGENDPPHLTVEKTEQALARLGIEYDDIIEGVTSPRVLVNDEGALAIEHPRNTPLRRITSESLRQRARSERIERIHRALAAVSWVAWKYAYSGDADDYVQTIVIAKSLADCGGFDHADLVARYRQPTDYNFHGEELPPSGIHPNYKGQMSKLLESDDPLYEATDGVADGAAMRVTAIAAFYADDFQALVENTDRITRITHSTVEARLSALLIALRLRQVLLGHDPDNMNRLVEELEIAAEILQFGDRADFFFKRVTRAKEIAVWHETPENSLYDLCRHIGMDHLAWSTPIAACFWSYHCDKDHGKWFSHQHEKRMFLPPRRFSPFQRIIHGRTLKQRIHVEDALHLRAIGQFDNFVKSHAYHWRTSVDIDTFLSIAISILAVRHGLDSIDEEVSQALAMFDDNLTTLSTKLACGPNSASQHSSQPAGENGII